MKKLLPLLSVLLLISCVQEDIQQPVGSDFEVLNIERNQTDILIYYNLDILYTGKVDSESLIKKVKEIHQQYSDVPEGEKIAIFSSSGNLEIAINKGVEGSGGGANKLFGLKMNDTITIEFKEADDKSQNRTNEHDYSNS